MKKFKNREQAAAYVDTLPLASIREMLIDLLVDDAPRKIAISEEQFKAFFKLINLRLDGSIERRGRPRKEE